MVPSSTDGDTSIGQAASSRSRKALSPDVHEEDCRIAPDKVLESPLPLAKQGAVRLPSIAIPSSPTKVQPSQPSSPAKMQPAESEAEETQRFPWRQPHPAADGAAQTQRRFF